MDSAGFPSDSLVTRWPELACPRRVRARTTGWTVAHAGAVFIAHLPAGYLATRAILRGRGLSTTAYRRMMRLGLAASVLPDLDLLYHYLVDDRRRVHHAYLPHLPLAWVAVLSVAALAMVVFRTGMMAWIALAVLGANVMLHVVLDTTAGGIRWGWPFTRAEFALAQVTARHDPWWWNFVLHWTFALELAIAAAAGWVYRRERRMGR